MKKQKAARISPLGDYTRDAAARRRAESPAYAAAEKKYEIPVAIADIVILYRTRQNITQEELAARMGTSVPAISRLESGMHTPSIETLRKLAQAMGGRVKIDIVDIGKAKTARKSTASRVSR
jgi:ribosome-binding protein aMBF1 (putative translation factor)